MAVTKRIALAFTFTLINVIAHNAKLIVEACDGHGHSHHADHFHHQDETVQQGRNLIDYSWSIEKDFQKIGARCMTPDADDDDIAEISRIVENWTQQPDLRYEVIKIPLYIHVMENEDGDGAVSDVQINDQVDVMNEAFGPELQYVLQEKIVTVNNEWHRCELGKNERDMKNELRRGGSETLNIYLCEPKGGLLGWATLPTKYQRDPSYDGVVAHTESIPGGLLAPYNLGYTAVHEAGHWVGLRHTFQNGCNGSGDGIADTPAESSPAFGCPVGKDSCKDSEGEDPINNFMNYSDDTCMTEFTPGQTVAMIASYIELRAVPGSIQEIQENDESGTAANSTSDSLSQQSETTGNNNVDDGNEPSESGTPANSTSDSLSQQSETTSSDNVDDGSEPSESQVGSESTSENTSTDNSGFAAFSSIFGFPPSASSGSAGGSGFGSPQNNAGTSSFQTSIFGSYGGFGSGGNGGGGGGQADIFSLSSAAAPSSATTDSSTCALKSDGALCSGGSQCCSGVCGGVFFFDKKCV